MIKNMSAVYSADSCYFWEFETDSSRNGNNLYKGWFERALNSWPFGHFRFAKHHYNWHSFNICYRFILLDENYSRIWKSPPNLNVVPWDAPQIYFVPSLWAISTINYPPTRKTTPIQKVFRIWRSLTMLWEKLCEYYYCYTTHCEGAMAQKEANQQLRVLRRQLGWIWVNQWTIERFPVNFKTLPLLPKVRNAKCTLKYIFCHDLSASIPSFSVTRYTKPRLREYSSKQAFGI